MSKKSQAEKLQSKYHKAPFVSDLKDLLYRSAKKYEFRNAFQLKDSTRNIYGISYKNFKKDVMALGTALIHLGFSNSRIAVIGKNSYSWAVSYLASVIVGVVVPIDKELLIDDIANFVNMSDSKVVLCDEKFANLISDNIGKFNNKDLLKINFNSDKDTDSYKSFSALINLGKKLIEDGDTSFDDIIIDPDEMHIILFTSGTTGNAKGVCLSHKNICSCIMSTYGIVKVKRSDHVLSVLPLHHTYECTLGYLLVIYSGACISYCEGLRYINKNIEEFRPSIFLCVPLLLEKMLKKIETSIAKTLPKYVKEGTNILDNIPYPMFQIVKRKVKNTLGGRLRAFIVGAAPLNPDIVKYYKKLGISALQGYGLTECSPLVAGNNDFYVNPEAVGLPIPNVEYKINNPDENGDGEILVKGPNVMLGYYNDEEATNKVIKDGWFYTGDLGRIDDEGWLYITGRCKTVIVTKNGKNVYPEELEHYLNDNPLISESLVTGLNYENDDETYVNAQILPNIDAIKEYLKVSVPQKAEIMAIMSDIVSGINKKLPNYKHIKSFIIKDKEFEKTTTQKIKRYGENLNIKKDDNENKK